MTEKSHVAIGYHLCPACMQEHTECVVLHKQLKKTLPQRVFVDWELCPEHKEMKDKGYVLCVEVTGEPKTLEQAHPLRTGVVAGVRAEVWEHLTGTPVPESRFAFIAPAFTKTLRELPIVEEASPTIH